MFLDKIIEYQVFVVYVYVCVGMWILDVGHRWFKDTWFLCPLTNQLSLPHSFYLFPILVVLLVKT